MNNCIVTQIHIPDYDIQGNLYSKDKQEILDISIQHLRKYNPDTYIILTGHGYKPYQSTLDLCDWYYWEDRCRPINEYGFIKDMPAQFVFVSIGIKHAIEKGFKRLLKTRGDSVIGLPNIILECEKILTAENKKLLLTQQTGMVNHILGDCFMYGDIELLDGMWDLNNPVINPYWGREHVGYYFAKMFGDEFYLSDQKWNELLKKICAFKNVTWMKYLDLRWNFKSTFEEKWEIFKLAILNNTFDFNDYYWGKKCGWHDFYGKIDLANINGPLYSEATFYV